MGDMGALYENIWGCIGVYNLGFRALGGWTLGCGIGLRPWSLGLRLSRLRRSSLGFRGLGFRI